jgi:biotin transporter BioY
MKRRNLIVTLTLSALFCTLICIGSFIRIPMPNMMPVTLQTFFVLLTALVLPLKASTLATFTYMALGFIGLPIFSGGGGLGYILMPNFGFVIGFVIATVIISFITEKLNNRKYAAGIVKDLRVLTNTVEKAADTLRKSGIFVETASSETEAYYNITITIPKSQERFHVKH